MDIFYLIFQQTLMVAVAITMVSLGGMFTERSGVTNIALEGVMVFGAFAGIMFINILQGAGSTMNPQIMLLCAIALSGIAGVLISLLLAYASVTMNADQTVGGTAINMIAPAVVLFLSRFFVGGKNVSFSNTFYIRDGIFLSKIPVIGDLLFKNTYITIYIGLIIWALAIFVLYKTRFGLRLRSCGEHPQAADSLGISVHKMRYAGVALSGLLGGMGGVMLIVVTTGTYAGSVNGYGFLALAVMIFGQWKPKYIFFAAMFFALLNTIAAYNSAIPFLDALKLPTGIYRMIPYVATLVVLAFTSSKSRAPKAVGIPYDKGQR